MSQDSNPHDPVYPAEEDWETVPDFTEESPSDISDTAPADPPARQKPYYVTAAIIAVTFVVFLFEPINGAPAGMEEGIKALNGEWWLLFTAQFVHSSLKHILGNMFFLWLFGKRLERILGKWAFLAFYLSCGLAGALVSIAHNPERSGLGASGAVFGVAGGLVSFYGLRVRIIPWKQRWKLAFLVAWVGGNLYDNYFDSTVGMDDHVGGLLLGLVLGAILSINAAQSVRRRRWIFAGVGTLLLLGAIAARRYDRYMITLGTAAHELDKGRLDGASREIQAAMRMKPDSQLAHAMARDVIDRKQKEGALPSDNCAALPDDPLRENYTPITSPCDERICDGKIHTAEMPDGRLISYRGIIGAPIPAKAFDSTRSTTTTEVLFQALDQFGEIACTVDAVDTTTQKLDAKGNPTSKTIHVETSGGTISQFDPKAVSMREDALQNRR
jgi:rhomboid protease GluP